jgi:restriction system protein
MAEITEIPRHLDLTWPTLQVIKDLGGSARIEEITEAVIEREGFTEEQQAVRRHPDDRMSMIEYRLAWARNYLKNIGAIENSARGVWSITDDGQAMSESDVSEAVKRWKTEYNRAYYEAKREQPLEGEDEEGGEPEETGEWKDALLGRLLELEPGAFERLAQRLLREAGFKNVEVVGRSGDGGLDGVGVYRLSLVSFPVYFQCKRWKNAVSAGAVRDFRGAMSGRGEKGLLISTSTFTREAREEATRDGAPARRARKRRRALRPTQTIRAWGADHGQDG